MALSSAHTGTHTGPLCTAVWSWANVTQCSACARHHGVYSWVGERHRTEGTWLAMLAGYSTGTPGPSTARTEEAHPSARTAAAARGTLNALALCAFARAQRRRALRHPRRPTSATPTRPRARGPSRRRAGQTSPTRRVRAMRSTRPTFPHYPHSPPFSSRHPRRSQHCIALGPPPGG
jgi:hypothetical protein